MAAEVHLCIGREPAYPEHAVFGRKEGGFREVVLSGDGLHEVLGQPFSQGTHGCGVAREHLGCECIHLIHRDLHERLPPCMYFVAVTIGDCFLS